MRQILVFIVFAMMCFLFDRLSHVSAQVDDEHRQPTVAPLVISLRQDFPKRRGIRIKFDSKSFPNEGDDTGAAGGTKFLAMIELEVCHDLSRIRSSSQIELPTHVYCSEELLMESQTLQAVAIGKTDEAGKFHIDPNIAQTLILKQSVFPFDRGNNPYLKGGELYLGLFSGMEGVFDIHGDHFADECVLKKLDGHVALIHEKSETTFLFDRDSLLLKEIESKEPLVDSEGKRIGTIVQRRIIEKEARKDGSVMQFTVHVKSEDGRIIRTLSTLSGIEKLGMDANVSKFRLLDVEEGSAIVEPGQPGKRWQFKDGKAVPAIDPDAETEFNP